MPLGKRLLRTLPTAPRCAACDYDFAPRVDGACPECGADIAESHRLWQLAQPGGFTWHALALVTAAALGTSVGGSLVISTGVRLVPSFGGHRWAIFLDDARVQSYRWATTSLAAAAAIGFAMLVARGSRRAGLTRAALVFVALAALARIPNESNWAPRLIRASTDRLLWIIVALGLSIALVSLSRRVRSPLGVRCGLGATASLVVWGPLVVAVIFVEETSLASLRGDGPLRDLANLLQSWRATAPNLLTFVQVLWELCIVVGAGAVIVALLRHWPLSRRAAAS